MIFVINPFNIFGNCLSVIVKNCLEFLLTNRHESFPCSKFIPEINTIGHSPEFCSEFFHTAIMARRTG